MENAMLCIASRRYAVLQLKGTERLSQPFCFTLRCKKINDALLKQRAILELNNNKQTRRIHGVITHTQQTPDCCELTLEPPITLLKHNNGPDRFIHQTAADIIQSLLTKPGIYQDKQIHWRQQHSDTSPDFQLQLAEQTDFDFLTMLINDNGFFYWFDEGNIHIADHHSALKKMNLTLTTTHAKNYTTQKNMLWDFSIKTQHVPSHFIAHSYCQSLNLSTENIIGDQANAASLSSFRVKDSPNTDNTLNRIQKNRAETARTSIKGLTHCTPLMPGQIITINFNAFDKSLTDIYQIIDVRHHANYPDHLSQGKATPYQQELRLIPANITFQDCVQKSFIPQCLLGSVEAMENSTLLDEQGHYRVRYDFDKTTAPKTQASSNIPRLLPYAGPKNKRRATGWHFPLYDNTSVILGCFHQDASKPFILSSLPNAKHPSPVNRENASQLCLKTYAGNYLLLDDHPKKQQITLAMQNNQLFMSKQQRIVHLNAQKGSMDLNANNAINIIAQGSHIERTKKSYKITVQHDGSTQVNNNAYYHANTVTLQSQHRINLQAKSMSVEAGKHYQLNTQTLKMSSESGEIRWQANSGTIKLSSKTGCQITTKEPVHITTGASGILLEPSGQVTIYGQQVAGLDLLGAITQHTNPREAPGKL